MDDDVDCRFYLCPVCFEACEYRIKCHGRMMVECNAGQPGDERRKPVIDAGGDLKSREPHWFLEAVGWIPVR